jgi:hypothetical protein
MTIRLGKVPSRNQLEGIFKAALAAAAVEATNIIRERASKGRDVDGNSFRKYSDKYSATKGSSGRNTDPVDLTLSGEMLGALQVLRVESPTLAWIGWSGQHKGEKFVRLKRGRKGVLVTNRRGQKFAIKRSRLIGPVRESDRFKIRAELKSTGKAVPYKDLIDGLQRNRKFFGISRPEEIARLVKVYEAAVADGA